MRRPPSTSDHLRSLVSAANRSEDLVGSLEQLLALAQRAVPSCVAVTLVLESDGMPVTVTASARVSDRPHVRSSLALPMPARDTTTRDGATPLLVLYGSQPGAFDAVARDLLALLDMSLRHAEVDGHLSIPDPDGDAKELGARLSDRRAVDLALGMLLDRGLLPADGRAELQRLGQALGSNHVDAAHRLVSRARTEPCAEQLPGTGC